MGLSCGASCIKILLIIFNVIFFLTGAAILAIGIWLMVDPNNDILVLLPNDYDPLYRGSVILLMSVGAATFVVGFFGCCGACKESPCMLGTFGTLLIIILIAEIVGGVMAAVFRNRIGDTVLTSMEKQVKDSSIVKFNISDTSDTTNIAWHSMQITLGCCGANNYTDYRANSNFQSPNLPVPASCCVTTNKKVKDPKFVDIQKCFQLDTPKHLQPDGCYEAFVDFLSSQSTILIGIGIGIGVLQLLGIVLAFCLCNSIRKGEKYA